MGEVEQNITGQFLNEYSKQISFFVYIEYCYYNIVIWCF